MSSSNIDTAIEQAAGALRAGGVVAYPTEAVYGLGCDPHNEKAFRRLFALKQRPATQGVLLIGACFEQVAPYIDFDAIVPDALDAVRAVWPGPQTFVFPRAESASEWIAGSHPGIALRVTAHPVAAALCQAFGGALVSTSANPHGLAPARDAATVRRYFSDQLGALVDGSVGGMDRPTPIRDACSGAILRK